MIDFRYHIVSLISVFLALAVGIILGAGPLQGAIGDQLTGQVEQLRVERNELRDQLDAANVQVADDARFIEGAGPHLVADTLPERRVAVVDLGGVDDERYDSVVEQLEAAGASVAAHVRVTDAWTDEADESARRTVAEGLGEYLGDQAPDAEPEARLATALAVALTGVAPTDADARSEDALELESLLVRFDLVSVLTEQTEPADVVLVLTGAAPQLAEETPADGEAEPGTETETAGEDEQVEVDTYAVDIEVEIARAAQAVAQAALVAGPTAVDGDVVSTIRSRDDVAGEVSTVSGIENEAGRIAIPLALAARLADQVGQYGFEDSATAVLPPAVELEPVDRTPAEEPSGFVGPEGQNAPGADGGSVSDQGEPTTDDGEG